MVTSTQVRITYRPLLYFSLGRKRLSDEEIEQLKEESYDQLSEGMIHSLRTKTRKMIKNREYRFQFIQS